MSEEKKLTLKEIEKATELEAEYKIFALNLTAPIKVLTEGMAFYYQMKAWGNRIPEEEKAILVTNWQKLQTLADQALKELASEPV